jgi:hypothetical protein
MKKILLGLCLVFLSLVGKSQQGLEKLIVEKYYVSDANDAAAATAAGGNLPVASVTWRIYADMAPDWFLVNVYGVPAHTLTMTTTTSFYNDVNNGSDIPGFNATKAKQSTSMIDSWISTGYGCNGYKGVLKTEDNGVGTFVNSSNPKVLQNNDAGLGIPLTTQDGLISGTISPTTIVGINTDAIGDGTVTGNKVFTDNGSWYSTSTTRTQGAFPSGTNKVLIAQVTTDGIFHYELNVQVAKDLGGGNSVAESYVASNPQAGEFSGAQYNLSGTLPVILPTVSITAPIGGTFHAPEVVTIAANASDADGSVVKVEFYINGVKAGEDVTAPYQFNWTSIAEEAILTAVATDNENNKQTSSPVTITVTGNKPPTVNITTPSSGVNIIAGDIVSITAEAGDIDGTVAKVEFYVNSIKVGEVANAPYKYDWTSVKSDTTILKALAIDNGGVKSDTARVSVKVTNNQKPEVNITSVHAGNLNLGAYLFTANATDVDGTISKVEFFIDNAKIGEALTSPYQYTWANNALGRHTLYVVATDNRGAITTTPTAAIQTVAPPTISIASPLAGALSNVGEVVTITATAADVDGTVVSVEFFVDGTSIGIDNTTPFSANYTGVAGSHTLTAKATDDSGTPTTSDPVVIIVNTPPTINITAPAANASSKVAEIVVITSDASDADGTVASVEFFVDGVSIGIDNAAPFAINYLGVLGSHVITAKATDNNGSQTTSSSVTLNVTATGIVDINHSSSTLKIYPNPAIDVVTLDITASRPYKNVSYKIISMDGQVIVDKMIGTINDNYFGKIDISSLSKGQYTIEVVIDGSILIRKLIKL